MALRGTPGPVRMNNSRRVSSLGPRQNPLTPRRTTLGARRGVTTGMRKSMNDSKVYNRMFDHQHGLKTKATVRRAK